MLLYLGKGARVYGCVIVEGGKDASGPGRAPRLHKTCVPPGCGGHQSAELKQVSSTAEHAAAQAAGASDPEHAAELGRRRPPQPKPNVLTKWLSIKASPAGAQDCGPAEQRHADADKLHTAGCGTHGRAATGETALLGGVRLLWADANQEPEAIRKRLLWHLRRSTACST